MYTSKHGQKEKEYVVQDDEKRAGYEVKNGEILLLQKCDTLGYVCMELLNDTPGYVDKHKA